MASIINPLIKYSANSASLNRLLGYAKGFVENGDNVKFLIMMGNSCKW